MSRFFLSEAPEAGVAYLKGEEARHFLRVLRAQPGELLTLADPQGRVYEASYEGEIPDGASFRILKETRETGEMKTQVTVFQAVIKGDHFDYAVQKCVEAGAMEIVPFLSHRCVKRPKSPERFCERAQKIALEAAKQCGRGIIPQVFPIIEFDATVKMIQDRFSILAYEREESGSLKALLERACPSAVSIAVGPEGGFTENEVSALTDVGAHAVSLGPRVLRSESAAPYMLAQINYACEE